MSAPSISAETGLLASLARALADAPTKVKEIEVGVALSIALGRQRPAVSCGGCSTGLEFQGIPARTVVHLDRPFRLVFDGPASPS